MKQRSGSLVVRRNARRRRSRRLLAIFTKAPFFAYFLLKSCRDQNLSLCIQFDAELKLLGEEFSSDALVAGAHHDSAAAFAPVFSDQFEFVKAANV